MRKLIALFYILLLACDSGKLKVVTDLPKSLKEASGLEMTGNSELLWIINDGGNKSTLYGVDTLGTIQEEIKIKAKNKDWEDLTSDKEGNIYIGDFGNNSSHRKDLVILKVSKDSIKNKGKVNIERISFAYEDQQKFPPKEKNRYFDCESFFFYKDSLYLFTKSRNPKDKGRTNLYQIPAKPGNYKAKFISSFTTCSKKSCWVTSADINDSESKVVLLTEHSAWIFTDFKSNDFFNGSATQYLFDHYSQKESVLFKNDSTLYITDERSGTRGGNLYELNIR